MDYKDMVIEDLRGHNKRKQSLDSMKLKLEALECEKTSLGGMSDSEPVQNSDINRQEEKWVNIISEQGRLNNQIRSTELRVRMLDNGLAMLDDAQYKILDRLYINPIKKPIECLCEELDYEKAHIYRIKDKALYSLTLCMYGGIDL